MQLKGAAHAAPFLFLYEPTTVSKPHGEKRDTSLKL
jgi:hypothetical protein